MCSLIQTVTVSQLLTPCVSLSLANTDAGVLVLATTPTRSICLWARAGDGKVIHQSALVWT